MQPSSRITYPRWPTYIALSLSLLFATVAGFGDAAQAASDLDQDGVDDAKEAAEARDISLTELSSTFARIESRARQDPTSYFHFFYDGTTGLRAGLEANSTSLGRRIQIEIQPTQLIEFEDLDGNSQPDPAEIRRNFNLTQASFSMPRVLVGIRSDDLEVGLGLEVQHASLFQISLRFELYETYAKVYDSLQGPMEVAILLQISDYPWTSNSSKIQLSVLIFSTGSAEVQGAGVLKAKEAAGESSLRWSSATRSGESVNSTIRRSDSEMTLGLVFPHVQIISYSSFMGISTSVLQLLEPRTYVTGMSIVSILAGVIWLLDRSRSRTSQARSGSRRGRVQVHSV